MLPLKRTDLDTRITKEANQPRGTTVGMTLSGILQINGKKYPHSNAISFEGEKASFRELDERVSRRANALLDLGVRRGDHVATLSHNSLALIESVLAIFRAGAVLVTLNARLSPQGLAHILNHSDAKMILFSVAFEDAVRKIAPAIQDAVRLICFGRKHSSEFIDLDAKASEQSRDFPAVEIQERDTATILYTAGTTGKPKVLEIAVFGVPDKTWGQKVCAAVVLKRGEQMTSEEVIGFCKENLASFKKPKSVAFVDALPRNPQQKVLRSGLKMKYMGRLA